MVLLSYLLLLKGWELMQGSDDLFASLCSLLGIATSV